MLYERERVSMHMTALFPSTFLHVHLGKATILDLGSGLLLYREIWAPSQEQIPLSQIWVLPLCLDFNINITRSDRKIARSIQIQIQNNA